MEFKLLEPALWTQIKEQIDSDFGVGVSKELVEDLTLVLIGTETEMSIYLVPMDWITKLELGFGSFELYSLGLFFGEIIGDEFNLNISNLYRLAPLTTNRIIISGKGAESFTYGKSILQESVREVSEDLKKGQKVAVLNENQDCLGLATMSVDGYRVTRMKHNDLVAKNLVDIGLYYRKFY
jgi:ribosome biogenesis protein Nip4